MDPTLLLFFVIVLLGYMVGATVGFGASILTLTIAAHLYPIDYLVPVLVPINLAVTIYLTVRHRRGVNRALLLKRILPIAMLGMPVGLAIFHLAETETLKLFFGLFVTGLAGSEVFRLARRRTEEILPPLSNFWTWAFLFSGGVVQGLWVSGGPMVAYWAGRNIRQKYDFRSTLSALWLVLNFVLLIAHSFSGTITAETLKVDLYALPFLVVGVALGEVWHARLPERTFRLVVFSVLIVAGLSIILRSL